RARDLGPAGKDNLFGNGLLTLGAPPTNTGPTPTTVPTLAAGVPAVRITITKIAANRLQVTITAAASQTMSSLAWTLPATASAETTGGVALPTGVTLPAGTTTTSFVLIRNSGASATLPLVATGSFGTWRTFVGGGPNAW